MRVDILNSLIESTKQIMSMTMFLDNEVGSPALVQSPIAEEPICILVGTTGELRGQVVLSFSRETALNLSIKMMQGFGSGAWDDLARSALQELGNMIMGTFSTLLSQKDIIIDITPPTMIEGNGLSLSGDKGIKVPLTSEVGVLNLTIMLKEN